MSDRFERLMTLRDYLGTLFDVSDDFDRREVLLVRVRAVSKAITAEVLQAHGEVA